MGAQGGARRDVLRARPRTSRLGRACGRTSIGRSLGARRWGRLARLLITAAPFAFRRAVHGLLVVVTDKTGDYTISFKEFLCGIAPLITGTVIEKITFALELYDLDGAGLVKPFQFTFVLKSMNSTASFFGDPVMTQEQIEQLTDEVFKEFDKDGAGEIGFSMCVQFAAENVLVQSFINGKGTVRFGSSR